MFRMSNVNNGIPEFLDSGRWMLDSGPSRLDAGRCTFGAGLCALDIYRWLFLILFQFLILLDQIIEKFFGCESLRTSWSPLFCRDYRFWRGYFWKFYINVKCNVIKECQKQSLLWKIGFHYKQLSWTVHEQSSTAIHFQKFIQKILVVESFFWSNYKWLFRVAIIY